MEIILTLGIFVSSILVLSIEKNWWGGYLSMEESDDNIPNVELIKSQGPRHMIHFALTWFHQRAHLIHQHRVFQTYKQELYTLNNLIRLVIVASSISFFVIISMLEVLQLALTFFYGRLSNFI